MPKVHNLSPMEDFFRDHADPKRMAELLDQVEERYLTYNLNDQGNGFNPELEPQWYYLRQLRKTMERIDQINS